MCACFNAFLKNKAEQGQHWVWCAGWCRTDYSIFEEDQPRQKKKIASYKGFQREADWTGCHTVTVELSMVSNPESDRSNPVRRTYSPKLALEARKLEADDYSPQTPAVPVVLSCPCQLRRCPAAHRRTWREWWCGRSCCSRPSLGKPGELLNCPHAWNQVLYWVVFDNFLDDTWMQETRGVRWRKSRPVLVHHHRGSPGGKHQFRIRIDLTGFWGTD